MILRLVLPLLATAAILGAEDRRSIVIARLSDPATRVEALAYDAAGNQYSAGTGPEGMFIAKRDASGNELFHRILDPQGYRPSIALLPDGGMYLVNTSGSKGYLARIDSNGEMLASYEAGEGLPSLALTPSGDAIVASAGSATVQRVNDAGAAMLLSIPAPSQSPSTMPVPSTSPAPPGTGAMSPSPTGRSKRRSLSLSVSSAVFSASAAVINISPRWTPPARSSSAHF